MALVIYPQGWLHNANVYGFLKVINEKSKEGKISFKLSDILKDDGTVVLTDETLDELYLDGKFDNLSFPRLFVFILEETVKIEEDIEKSYNYFRGNVGYYENYVAQVKKEKFMENLPKIIRSIFRKPVLLGSEQCFFCGNPLKTDENKSILQRKQFSRILFKEFSSSEGKFPNSFWNMSNEFYLCDVCSQMALFRHFVFPRRGEGIFVNVPSFKAIWYLNEAIQAYKNLSMELSVSRAISEVHLKLQRLLGIWERQNVEIIHYDGKSYRMYYMPQRVLELLLNTRISSILNSLNSIKIFEAVIYQERLNEILDCEYLLIKYLLDISIAGKSHLSENVKQYVRGDARYYINALPDLFQEVRNTMGVKQMVPVWRMRELGREASQLFERTKYRLLELIRLAKKDEVYHLILKTYMTRKKPFPEELNKVFSAEDEDFKNLMFAYVSGMISGGEENE
ncbi:Cas8a1 family CRISPR/Cas system-associated protein [Thermotoga sp.]|uniref:Cas8a1 family CRISPR/Cas system-associated protein n=1 Tax=Thermotoga sp. TaxID=28240 RepID=UPI0025EF8F1D|nr:Cas8a1 family CRISPR/Cas system-associated protein [Thermotoga sp.]MCD6552066.1 type I-B CRISPR-associated protein Cas8b1/Cst1 [Thermotoga sp.]